MRLDEEEVLIRDDSGLLLDTSEVRVPKSQAWTRKLTRTMCLSLGFLVLGLCVAIPGPTLLDLEDQLQATTSQMMIVFASRSLGYLLGALLGGVLFDCFDKQLLLFCTLLLSSVATVVIPWSLTLVVMATMFALQGITMGVLDTGGNVYCIQLWGKKNAPFIQTLHFAFGIGAFVAPLLARPFLSHGVYIHNSTEIVQGNIPVAPFLHQHHVQTHNNMTKRSVIDIFEQLDAFHEKLSSDIDSYNAHKSFISKMNGGSSDKMHSNIYPMLDGINVNFYDNGKDVDSNFGRMKRHAIKTLFKREDTSESVPEDPVTSDTDNEITKATSNVELKLQNSTGTTSKTKETLNASLGITDASNNASANDSKIIDTTLHDIKSPISSTIKANVIKSTAKPVSSTVPSTPVVADEEPVKKPSAATDNNRESSSADGKPIGKHLDDHKDDNTNPAPDTGETLVIDTDSGLNKTEHIENENITNTSPEVETSSKNISNENNNITGVSTLTPGVNNNVTPSSNDAGLLNNKTSVSIAPEISTSKSDVNKTLNISDTTLSTKNSTKPSSVMTLGTKPAPSSTSNSTVTSSTEAPKTTTISKTTSTTSSTTSTTTTPVTTTSTTLTTTTTKSVTTTKATTQKPVKPLTTKSPAVKPTTSITSTEKNSEKPPQKTTEHKESTKKPSTVSSSVTQPGNQPDTVTVHDGSKPEQTTVTSLNNSVSNITNYYLVTTEVSKKPETTVDSFIHHAIAAVKNISRIQFAYVIIGLSLFLIAIVFLVLYCRDKGGGSVRGDFEDLERFKSISACSKNSLILLLGMFYFCYMGLEVTFGALVTTFAVEYNHWPKEQGAVVAAIFWGSLATGRGLSIFISRCCGPTLMLAIDLFFMIVGGLILAIGIPYMDVLLWLGTLILGLGMSSAFPAGISWAESRFHLSGKSTAVLVIGSAIGQMLIPILSGYLYDIYGAMSLMYITVALTVTALLIFILMQCASLRGDGTLKVSARNGFLPLEDNDEDDDDAMEMGDLVHFDKSQTRTIRDRRRGEDAMYHTLISDLEDD
ncbi:hypothetical protein ACF0H5_015362 [Mactra antiquata]